MIEVKKSIESGQPYGLYDILKQLQHAGAGIGGQVYFVENNAGSDTNDGLSWDTAFKTLAYAIGISNDEITGSAYGYGRGWAARNTIFCKGDSICEDLTVPPVKCDVIGCGSTDAFNKTEIKGEHSWTGSGTLMSSGFYNLQFVNDDASAVFTVASLTGLYFGDCDFIAESDSIHAIHITGTTGHDLKINNCRFINDEYADPFDTAAILVATTTTFWNLEIKDSYVEGDIGIKIDTTNLYNGRIDNCVVKAVTVTIDDDSSDCVITNNCLISAADESTIGNVLDYTAALAANNILTGSGNTITAPTLSDLTTA